MTIYNEDTDPNVEMWNKQNKKTITHRVVFEIEVEADSPLEAARTGCRIKTTTGSFMFNPATSQKTYLALTLQKKMKMLYLKPTITFQ